MDSDYSTRDDDVRAAEKAYDDRKAQEARDARESLRDQAREAREAAQDRADREAIREERRRNSIW